MFLSIIVPVYNTSCYLRRCVDSLLSQGLDEGTYEILLIDDGSKDDSLSICRMYEEKYPGTIRVFSKANEGVSATRNLGIREAKGEYVQFMDSDDYLIPSGFRYLMDNYMTPELDILSFFSLTMDRKVKATFKENNNCDGKIHFDGYGRQFLEKNIWTFVTRSLYRRRMLLDNGFFFDDMVISEDVMYNLRIYMEANPRLRIVSSVLYRYDMQKDSIIHRRDIAFVRKSIDAYVMLIRVFQKYIDQTRSSNPVLSRALKISEERQMMAFISRVLSSDYSVSEFRKLKQELVALGVLPMDSLGKISKTINLIFRYPSLVKMYEMLYRRIFIPLILPHLSRN